MEIRITSTRVALRSLERSDLNLLYELEVLDTSRLGVGRYQGRMPSPSEFEHDLWQTVQYQVLVTSSDRPSTPLAHLACYSADVENGVCWVSALRFADGALASDLVMEALTLFIGLVFDTLPIRKVYFETPDFPGNDYASAVRLGILSEEGRYNERRYFASEYWDVVIYSLTRDRWLAVREIFGSAVGM